MRATAEIAPDRDRARSSYLVLVADLGVASRVRDRLGHEHVRCVSLETVPDQAGAALLVTTAIPIPWALITKMAMVNTGLIVVVDEHDDDDEYRAIECGAAGYISMSMSPAAMRSAIAGVGRDEPAFTRRVLGRWLRSRRAYERPNASTLPRRQQEIVALIAEGKGDREIAAMLGIAVTTVHKHVGRMLKRLGAPSRAAAVASLRWGEHPAF